MRRAAIPAQAPQLQSELEPGDLTRLSHDTTYAEIALSDAGLVGEHANGVTFNTVRFTNVDLSGSRLDHLSLTDGAFAAGSLANLHARAAKLKRVVLETSRLTGIELPEAELCDVEIRSCRVDLASFGFSRLERVTFEDCQLAQTDFLEAQLESVRFHGCDLTNADFRGARLRRCEFRRSNLTDLQGVESLRGAAMEWHDIVGLAGMWAAALGIDVLDQD